MLWWGYVHINKSIQVKRFFNQIDIDDAYESPFVERVFEKFEANNREEAIKHIENEKMFFIQKQSIENLIMK
jgi:hypothetical protein